MTKAMAPYGEKFSNEKLVAEIDKLDFNALNPRVLAYLMRAMGDVYSAVNLNNHSPANLYEGIRQGNPLDALASISINVARCAYEEIMQRAEKDKSIFEDSCVLGEVCHFQFNDGTLEESGTSPALAVVVQATWQNDKVRTKNENT